MRIAIHFDSATTRQVRDLCVGLHHAGHTGELQVGVEGPECWGGRTPKLTIDEYRTVISHVGAGDAD